MADGGEGNLSIKVEVRYPDGEPGEVRETLREAGDLIGATVGTANLGADVVTVLDPIADDIASER
jgi:hypothetical protein